MARANLQLETTNDTSKAERSFDNIKSAAKKANAEIKKDGISISEELAKKNREGAKALVGRFTLVSIAMKVIKFIAEGLADAFNRMVAEGNRLREVATATGVSAETMAALKARADAAGVSLVDYEKALEDLKSGHTSLDELSRAWRDVAKSTYGAREANDRFFEHLSDNIEAITVSKNIERLGGGLKGFFRKSLSGLIRNVGFGTEAESTIEYAVQQGIRSAGGKDRAIRAAIAEQAYSPVEGTLMWNARYKELSNLFDRRASEADKERQNSRDDRIASLYDRLGENVGLVMNALAKMGLGNLSESEIEQAVNRSRARESMREKDDRMVRDLLKEEQTRAKEAADEENRQSAIDKTLVNYAYAKGGGLLAGINYGFTPSFEQQAERKKLVQLGKQTVSLTKVVAELKKVYSVLATD